MSEERIKALEYKVADLESRLELATTIRVEKEMPWDLKSAYFRYGMYPPAAKIELKKIIESLMALNNLKLEYIDPVEAKPADVLINNKS